jgi:hypothetical protein
MRAVVTVGLVALGGCASVHDPLGLDEPAMIVKTDSAVHVIGPDYELDFAPTGIHLPDHLTVDHGQVELLGSDDCAETKIGVASVPAVAIAAGTPHGATAVRSQITTVLAGPAIAKVHVSFEVDYACPGAQTATGAIDFTLFPSGRIVREDLAIRPSTDRLGMAGRCGCQQETDPMNFHDMAVTTFWAFDPAGATQVLPDGSPVTEDSSGALAACTVYPRRTIGVAWRAGADTLTTFPFPSHQAASHVLTWNANTDHKSVDPDPQSMTSAIQISNAASDCGGVLAKLADVAITSGGTVLDHAGHDGIYRDPVRHPDSFQIQPIDAAVPAGFAISVDLAGASHAILTRVPAADPIAWVQREDDTRFLLVFRDGLAPGQRITIEPRR